MATKQSGEGKRRSEAERRAILTRFADSGLGVTEFCRRECISDASFYRWRTSVGDAITARKSSSPVPAAFVDLGMLGAAPSAAPRMELKLDLGAGMVLHLVRG